MANLEPWEAAAQAKQSLEPWEEAAQAKKSTLSGPKDIMSNVESLGKSILDVPAIGNTVKAFQEDPTAAGRGVIRSIGPAGLSEMATSIGSMVGDAGLNYIGFRKSQQEIKKNAEERSKAVKSFWDSITDPELVKNKSFENASAFMDIPMIPGHKAAELVQPYSPEAAAGIENLNTLGMAILPFMGKKKAPQAAVEKPAIPKEDFSNILPTGDLPDAVKAEYYRQEAIRRQAQEPFMGPPEPTVKNDSTTSIQSPYENQTKPTPPEPPYSRVAPEGFYTEPTVRKGVPTEEPGQGTRPMSEGAPPVLANAETIKERPLEHKSMSDLIDETSQHTVEPVREIDPKTGYSKDPTPVVKYSEGARGSGAKYIFEKILQSGKEHTITWGKEQAVVPAVSLRELVHNLRPEELPRISGWQKDLINHTLKLIGDIPVTIGTIGTHTWKVGETAHYSPDFNIISVNPSHFKQAGGWKTIVHEAIHAATWYAINTKIDHPAVKALGSLYTNLVNSHPEILNRYGMTDLHEFVAETFSNPAFQHVLNEIHLPKEFVVELEKISPKGTAVNAAYTFFRGFIQAVAGILGIPPKSNSALIQAIRLGGDVMHGVTRDPISHGMLRTKWKFEGRPILDKGLSKDGIVSKVAPEISEVSTKDYLDSLKGADGKIGDMGSFRAQIGLSSASFRATTQALKAGASEAAKMAYHVTQKITQSLGLENQLNHAGRKVTKDFAAHYLPMKGLRTAVDLIKNDFKILVDMEKDHSWRTAPDQWYPTRDQLIQRGMSEKSADIWVGMHNLWDQSWKQMEAAAKINNIKMPDRIPGYIPHFFKGPYAVMIKGVNKADPSAKPIYFGEYNFSNKHGYQPFLDAANNQLHGKTHNVKGTDYTIEVSLEKPTAEGSTVGRELESLMAAAATEKIPALQKIVDSLAKDSAKGIISNVLERQVVPKVGHLAERINETGTKALTHAELRDAVRTFGTYHETVNRWYSRAKYVNETLIPLMDSGVLVPGSGLRKFVIDSSNAFMGITPKFLSSVDTFFRDQLIDRGMDPGLAEALFNGFTRGTSVFYLAGSIPYYIANTAQVLQTYPIMLNASAELALKVPGKNTSVVKAIKDSANITDNARLLDWARERGHIEPTQMEHIFQTAAAESAFSSVAMQAVQALPTAIEKSTRAIAFINGYHLAKQVMKHEDALKFAGEFTDKVAVPYSMRAGAPLLFSQVPAPFRSLTMFLTYQQHQLGLLNNSLQIASANKAMGNYGAVVKAYSSLAALQALNVSLFGLGALPFSGMYDGAAYLMKLMGIKEMGRLFDRFLDDKIPGFKDKNFMSMGAISQMVGYDVSSSGSGVNIMMSTVGPRIIEHIATASVLGMQWARGIFDPAKQATDKELWEWASTLPGSVKGHAEFLIRGGWGDAARGAMKSHVISKDINKPLAEERTPAETAIRVWTGLETVQAKQAQVSESIYNQKIQQNREVVDRILQLDKEGKLVGKELAKAHSEIARMYGTDPDTAIRVIVQAREEALKTQDQRVVKGATLADLLNYQLHQNIRKQEPGR